MKFSIKAGTYTLKSIDVQNCVILDGKTKYTIPIYQRPYSWTEEQIDKCISDIFGSFWGNQKQSKPEPMFIGTMQLSKVNLNGEQDIIDGQQRLTTFLLFLKSLNLAHPENKILSGLNLSWLVTEVNNGKQQENLTKALSLNSLENVESTGLNKGFCRICF